MTTLSNSKIKNIGGQFQWPNAENTGYNFPSFVTGQQTKPKATPAATPAAATPAAATQTPEPAPDPAPAPMPSDTATARTRRKGRRGRATTIFSDTEQLGG